MSIPSPVDQAAATSAPLVRRTGAELRPDPARVIARLFRPGDELPGTRSRVGAIAARVLALDEATVAGLADRVLAEFADRHPDYPDLLVEHAAAVAAEVDAGTPLTPARRLVLGAAFTAEYATEAAALCNPSAMLHPDQDGLAPGQARVAVSLRAIGEGHVSSIAFCTALVGPGDRWVFEPRTAPAVAGVSSAARPGPAHPAASPADPGPAYEVEFDPAVGLAQRVLLPSTAEESNGMEDARFTRFTAADGTVEFRATYTAYDGSRIAPRLLLSTDLRVFRAHRLSGPAARNKGMALFPRPVGGRHLALCRVDGENISLATSADGLSWGDPAQVHGPTEPWELLQVGNCGPPLETDRGWLVLTHGVGAMRTYVLGALLLDLDDPSRVIARLHRPLMTPGPGERDGYVPNVLYSCGAVLHDGRLWIPYGIDDARIGVAWVPLTELLDAMTAQPASSVS